MSVDHYGFAPIFYYCSVRAPVAYDLVFDPIVWWAFTLQWVYLWQAIPFFEFYCVDRALLNPNFGLVAEAFSIVMMWHVR